jgi:hypothetical protein
MTRGRRRFIVRGLQGAAALAAGAPSLAAAAPPPDSAFAFALIGDVPYSRLEEVRTREVLSRIDEDRLELVIHVGDIKAGNEPCTDELLEHRRALLDGSAHPLVLTPGDNDWTDCHRERAGAFDPLERLQHLRASFFGTPRSLGRRTIALERQAGYPENARWSIGPVAFLALHVVGSNDGVGAYPGGREESRRRLEANRRWLDEGVERAIAADADGLVIAAHANPGFGTRLQPAHVPFRRMLVDSARRFTRPILFLNGDTHRFRTDRPLFDDDGRHYPNLVRAEPFGSPFASSWVRITYDPSLEERFLVTIRML